MEIVDYDEGLEMKRRIGAEDFIECSARTKENITDLFKIAAYLAIGKNLSKPRNTYWKRNRKKCALM